MSGRQGSAVALAVALAAAAGAQPLAAQPAPEWDALFDRTMGWTGGDGIYSIPLTGSELNGGSPDRPTLLVFSDTFIGKVLPDGTRAAGTTLVNNTMALLRGTAPDPDRITFYWGRAPGVGPTALFTPQTPDTRPDNWYWLMDGVALNGTLYLFALRMEPAPGQFPFAVAGVARLTADLTQTGVNVRKIQATHEQVDAPLFLPAAGPLGEVIFGSAILVNTADAGSPAPDGYVYIYGTRNDFLDKKLLVARVLPDQFDDFDAWRYWTGVAWVSAIEQAAPVQGVSRISSEQSVSWLPDGRFAVVSQLDGIGPKTQIHLGDSPIGPFEPPVIVWQCPEAATDPDIFCYNAKAHPHLSAAGELLISYNVNTFDFFDHFANADIYRPRFIRVTIGP